MELTAPRLVREFGFQAPVYTRDGYEAHATMTNANCILKVIGEGRTLWVYIDYDAGPLKRVELVDRVKQWVGRPFTPIEEGSAGVSFADKVLAWDDLLADYFTALSWTPSDLPQQWLNGF